MRLKIKNPQDFWCGLFFVALGVLSIYLSRDYAMGNALNMGPGYFPTWLGGNHGLLRRRHRRPRSEA